MVQGCFKNKIQEVCLGELLLESDTFLVMKLISSYIKRLKINNS